MDQLTSLIQNYRNVKFELIWSKHPLFQYYRQVSFELTNIRVCFESFRQFLYNNLYGT